MNAVKIFQLTFRAVLLSGLLGRSPAVGQIYVALASDQIQRSKNYVDWLSWIGKGRRVSGDCLPTV